MAQCCAYVYALHLDTLDRAVTADRTAAVIAVAMGAEGEIPDPDAARARFDEWLASEPERADPVQEMKLRALGLRE